MELITCQASKKRSELPVGCRGTDVLVGLEKSFRSILSSKVGSVVDVNNMNRVYNPIQLSSIFSDWIGSGCLVVFLFLFLILSFPVHRGQHPMSSGVVH